MIFGEVYICLCSLLKNKTYWILLAAKMILKPSKYGNLQPTIMYLFLWQNVANPKCVFFQVKRRQLASHSLATFGTLAITNNRRTATVSGKPPLEG